MIDNNAGEERRKSIYKEKTSAWVKILGTFTAALIVGLGSLNLSVSGSQENKLDVIQDMQGQLTNLSTAIITMTHESNSKMEIMRHEISTLKTLAMDINNDRVTKSQYKNRNQLIDAIIDQNENEHKKIYDILRYRNHFISQPVQENGNN